MSFAAEDDEEKKPPEKVKPADNPGDDLERAATDAFLFVVTRSSSFLVTHIYSS